MRKPFVDLTQASNLDYVQKINHSVADHLFPYRTFASMALKTYEEIGEMVANPQSAEEVADVMIMLMDHLTRIGGHAGKEILLKLQKNLDRRWGKTDGGVYKHLEGDDLSLGAVAPTFVTHEDC